MSFWNFKSKIVNEGTENENEVVELRIEGDIIDDSSVWLYEWFEEPHAAPNKFRNALKEHDGKELHVIVDSFGGDVFAGTSMFADIKSRNGKTIGIVPSKAMSAATLPLMACDMRIVYPGAMVMIHDPMTSIYGGNISEFEKTLDVMKNVKAAIINAYMTASSMSREQISDLMTAETWMDAHKAVELGFAHQIENNDGSQKFNIANFSRLSIINSGKTSIQMLKKFEDLQNQTKNNEDERKKIELRQRATGSFLLREKRKGDENE